MAFGVLEQPLDRAGFAARVYGQRLASSSSFPFRGVVGIQPGDPRARRNRLVVVVVVRVADRVFELVLVVVDDGPGGVHGRDEEGQGAQQAEAKGDGSGREHGAQWGH